MPISDYHVVGDANLAQSPSGQTTIVIQTPDKANQLSYNNTSSGLDATDVQGAIDEVDGRIDALSSNGAKNLLPMTLEGVKALNTSGTWSGNVYTYQGGTYTLNTDNDGNLTSISVTSTGAVYLPLYNGAIKEGDYLLNGCVDGSSSTYYLGYKIDTNPSAPLYDGDVSCAISNKINVWIETKSAVNNVTFYPMVRLATDTDSTFQPYAKTNLELTDDVRDILYELSRTRNNITDRLSNLPQAVAEQNLEKYGYKIGDYFERVDGNRTYTYHIADYNTFKGTSTPYCLTTNHIGIVVDTHAKTQWYSGDASSVGYNGSTLHTYLKGTVLDNIKADMIYFFGGTTGLEHLLSHSKLLTTALANWGWQANQYISALSEVQSIGSTVWSANGYQTGEAAKKLELFDKYKWTEIFEGRYPWLRDLYTSSYACNLGGIGYADGDVVTASRYAVGLINFY